MDSESLITDAAALEPATEPVPAHETTISSPVAMGKCPVCGSPLDLHAYHCAQCRNYFCYQCRARLLADDPQVECVNQMCAYYGKLMCGVCDESHEREEPPSVYAEPVDGYWPLWLVFSIAAGGYVTYVAGWRYGLLLAVVMYAVVGWLLQKVGVNIFGSTKTITLARTSTYRTCLHCQQPVKDVRPQR